MVACGGDSGGQKQKTDEADTDLTADAGDDVEDNDASDQRVFQACSPDPELIAQRANCQIDDDCPCGAYCDLGVCVADCSSDGDCGDGEACDPFGRCRGEDAVGTLQLPSDVTGGQVDFTLNQLALQADTAIEVSIKVGEHDVPRARVAGRNGAQVRCADGDEFSDECELEDLEANTQVTVEVQRNSVDAESEDVAEVTVHSPQGSDSISLPRPDQLPGYKPDGERNLAGPLQGVYSGHIKLIGVGSTANAGLDEPATPMQMNASATIWETGAGDVVVAIDDPLGALTSQAQLIGQVTLGADDDADGIVDGTAAFPVHPFATSTVAGRTTEIIAAFDAEVRTNTAPRTLSMRITQRFDGSGTSTALSARWLVELRRTTDVSDVAPEIPADVTVSYDPASRLGDNTPWQDAFEATLGTFGYANSDAALASRYSSWLLRGGQAPAQMCDAGADRARIETQVARKWTTVDGMTKQAQPRGYPLDGRLFQPMINGNSKLLLTDIIDAPDALGPLPGTDGGIPCAFASMQGELTVDADFFGAAETSSAATGVTSYCQILQQNTGCEIVTSSYTFDETVSMNIKGPIDKPGSIRVFGEVTAVCKLPSVQPTCAEQIACLEPADNTSPGEYEGSFFSTTTLPTFGSSTCASTTRTATIDLDASAATSDEAVGDKLQTCLSELEVLADAPGTPSGEFGVGFNELYGSASCIDVARLLTSLGVQTEAWRGEQALRTVDLIYPAAYQNRLLARWLELHAMLSTYGSDVSKLADVLQADPLPGDAPLPDQQRLLDTMLSGWDLLMAQHIQASLLEAPGDALVTPDYRFHRFGTTGDSTGEQNKALAAVLLTTLDRQAGFVNATISNSAGEAEEERLQPLARFVPRSVFAQALAAHLYRRALDADPNLAWKDQYERAASRFTKTIGQLQQTFASVHSGENPLGIDDTDLPLYFQASDREGADARFSAISRFIAGDPTNLDAWAPVMVQRAQDGIEALRTAYKAEHERKVREARAERDLTRWVDDVRDEYNAVLRDYCGPLTGSPVEDANFNAATCALNRDDASCTLDTVAWYRSWEADDVMGRICVADALRESTLDGDVGFAFDRVRQWTATCLGSSGATSGAVTLEDCANTADTSCLICNADTSVEELPLEATSLDLVLPGSLASMSKDAVEDWQAIKQDCRSSFPQMRLNVPLPSSPLETPGCVRGSLGEAHLDVVAAVQDIEQARAALAEHNEAYDIAMESCFILQEANDELQAARDSHQQNMQGLRLAKGIADGAAAAASGVKDCAGFVQNTDLDNPVEAIKDSGAAAAGCAAAGVETVANIASIALETEMENAQQRHENLVAGIEQQAELDICFNDAKQELIGAKTAAIELEKAVFEMQRARARVAEQTADAQRAWEDGYSYLAEIAEFPVPSGAGEPWINEEIDAYVRDYTLARRATFLAVRAVEYEFQQSLELRQAVIEAKVPNDLQTVLNELWTTSGTRSINGSRPTELLTVLSLRDDILQLGDESAWPDAFRPMSPAQRLKTVLGAEAYAVYDDEGSYAGQRIPFTIAPLGALGFETRGVPIYSENDCAERLWSLNASVVGDNLYEGSDTTFVRMDVLKKNTFFSQWCGAPPEGAERFQVASVRPSRNLFREPGLGEGVGGELGVEQGVTAFSRARIQAFLGVDRAELEDPQYANGQTSELAARGLYGEYSIFIPADVISRNGSQGLVLDRVDDILLRLDYLSVAN
ncbi:hypothetical protein FIV42_02705 [Persicimonas caeni]|uniref:Uncharacterized protein n=1 Tax=Persicimonas caeni TaxID=2292766 RepID=A0A4Y6PNV4_PERCE|nr:dickkopf-related protein [Persicimonas caeni]QDG49687.1 hypothetical protein FIV42_02705 [Persicimonas caeni]QED30908.1 hypothetical protein FRD00_02700 [Persicimonas caeni]